MALEVARRHRFFGDMASLPAGVAAHVLPTGAWTPQDSGSGKWTPIWPSAGFNRHTRRAGRTSTRGLDDMRGSVAT